MEEQNGTEGPGCSKQGGKWHEWKLDILELGRVGSRRVLQAIERSLDFILSQWKASEGFLKHFNC